LHIVHITPYFAPAFVYGGPPRSVLGLCHGLQHAGAQVSVVTTTANGDGELPEAVTSRAEFEGIAVRYLPRQFPKRNFRAARLEEALDRSLDRCDVVHIHGCWNFFGWTAARWCRRRGVAYGLSPRGMLHPWSFAHGRVAKWFAYRLLESRVLEGARFVHATSREEAEVVARLGAPGSIVTIPNGVERADPPAAESVHAFRKRYGFTLRDFVVLYLGRLHPKKGVDTLLDAFRQVADRSSSARLLVAGAGDPEYVRQLRGSARDLVRSGRAIFAGFLDGSDRRLAFAAADAFALTSHSENFGLSVAEAMAAARPVIVSRGCPWPQIAEWRAGIWVQNTRADVAAALDALVSDPSAARQLGENGQRAVRQHLDWNRLAAQMLDAYGAAARCVVPQSGQTGAVVCRPNG
jgi:glycosyltransferase involved in cell wall biosynthesis